MKEIKIGDKALVEMNVVGWDKITGDYQMKPKEDTRTFWASGRFLHPIAGTCDKTYEDGLREAWETARLIEMEKASGGLDIGDLTSIFGTNITPYIFRDNTAQEAAAKIAEWEGKQKINVGDVVELVETGVKGFITRSDDDGEDLYVVWEDGKNGRFYKSRESLKKTGRTIDIAGLLAQIGGTEDE